LDPPNVRDRSTPMISTFVAAVMVKCLIVAFSLSAWFDSSRFRLFLYVHVQFSPFKLCALAVRGSNRLPVLLTSGTERSVG
jgi:hypothetical protein